MPIIRRGKRKVANPLKQSFFEKIDRGKVVPLVSNTAINSLLFGTQQKLMADYADYIDYPFENRDNLLEMARYKLITEELDSWALKSDYLNFIKNAFYYLAQDAGVDEDQLEEASEQVDEVTVSQFAHLLDYPHFSDDYNHPLVVLANLPLTIYLTTSPYDFIEIALQNAGKSPRTEVCRWHSGLESLPSVFAENYTPSIQEPLVYHLHGFDQYPDSLVLTEDDYFEFVVNISRDKGQGVDPVPRRVRQAMSDSALMLLGYHLPSWSFRAIFWSLIQNSPMKHQGIFAMKVEGDDRLRSYLQKYLKRVAQLKVEWVDIREYAQQLRAGLRQ